MLHHTGPVMAVDINEAAFTPLPPWFIGLTASIALLVFLRGQGKKVSPVDGVAADLAIDIGVLLSACSVIASVGATPLVVSITNTIAREINPSGNTFSVGDSAQIGIGLAGLAVLVFLGVVYTRTESGMTLAWFALGVQVASLFTPIISQVLSLWINYPIRLFWNLLMWLLNFVPNLEVD